MSKIFRYIVPVILMLTVLISPPLIHGDEIIQFEVSYPTCLEVTNYMGEGIVYYVTKYQIGLDGVLELHALEGKIWLPLYNISKIQEVECPEEPIQ